jgi:hypothetical protein
LFSLVSLFGQPVVSTLLVGILGLKHDG